MPSPFILVNNFPGKTEFEIIDSLVLDNGNTAYIARDFPSRALVFYIVQWTNQTGSVIFTETISAAPVGLNGAGLIKCRNGTFYIVWFENAPIQLFGQLRKADGTAQWAKGAVEGINGGNAYIPTQWPLGRISGCAAVLNDEIWVFCEQVTGAGLRRAIRAIWLRVFSGVGIVVLNMPVAENLVANVSEPRCADAVAFNNGFAVSYWEVTAGNIIMDNIQTFTWLGIPLSPIYSSPFAGYRLLKTGTNEAILIAVTSGAVDSSGAVQYDCFGDLMEFTPTDIVFTASTPLLVTSLDYEGVQTTLQIPWVLTDPVNRRLIIMLQTLSLPTETAAVIYDLDFNLQDVVTIPETVDLELSLSFSPDGDFTVAYNYEVGLTSLFGLYLWSPTPSRGPALGTVLPYWGFAITDLSCTPCQPFTIGANGEWERDF